LFSVPRLGRKSSAGDDAVPLPLAELHTTLSESLEIAMGYLEAGRAYPYSETQVKAADAILAAWRAGARHRIRLANVGIVAVQQAQASSPKKSSDLWSFYPRVS
jgi:hypothetical protein